MTAVFHLWLLLCSAIPILSCLLAKARRFLLSCFPKSHIFSFLLHILVQAPELHRAEGHSLPNISKRTSSIQKQYYRYHYRQDAF
jgi:hypothetical protein